MKIQRLDIQFRVLIMDFLHNLADDKPPIGWIPVSNDSHFYPASHMGISNFGANKRRMQAMTAVSGRRSRLATIHCHKSLPVAHIEKEPWTKVTRFECSREGEKMDQFYIYPIEAETDNNIPDRYEIYVNGDYIGTKLNGLNPNLFEDIDHFLYEQGFREYDVAIDGDLFKINTLNDNPELKEVLHIYLQSR
ncbi:hypothetical protein ACFO4N_14525 [Camelliibacillus cellulosilyticus]|uniref:Uncharacterized protein n=1 Tax=Camelliibacillus cellulosilyticus TaxID=2174486 RepID=A0ABV9GTE0_9BACL